MRLRKLAFTAQFQNQTAKFKPAKRLMTQILEPRSSWFQENKVNMGKEIRSKPKFVRYSGKINTEGQKTPQKQRTLQDVLNWIKEHAIQQRNVTIDNQVREQNTKTKAVQRHLQHIMRTPSNPSKPSKLHKKCMTQAFFPLYSSRKRRDRTAQIPMERGQYAKCICVVDEIYNQISILKELGYTDSKIDGWIISFCDSRKPFLKKILMKNTNFSLKTLKQRYCYEKDIKNVKNKIRNKVRKSKQNYSYIQYSELLQFSRYLQGILIKKNQTKVKEVESSIMEKISSQMLPNFKANSFIYNKKEPTEVYNFVDELQNYEDRFGPFQSFSKVNKLRFMQLNRVEQKIKNNYQKTIEQQEQRIIEGRAEIQRTVTEGDNTYVN